MPFGNKDGGVLEKCFNMGLCKEKGSLLVEEERRVADEAKKYANGKTAY